MPVNDAGIVRSPAVGELVHPETLFPQNLPFPGIGGNRRHVDGSGLQLPDTATVNTILSRQQEITFLSGIFNGHEQFRSFRHRGSRTQFNIRRVSGKCRHAGLIQNNGIGGAGSLENQIVKPDFSGKRPAQIKLHDNIPSRFYRNGKDQFPP